MVRSETKTELYNFSGSPDSFEKLRYIAANKLQPYTEHSAGQGSYYIYIGNLKIRIADHENTSRRFPKPDINIINRRLSDEDVEYIAEKVTYPNNCKQKAFSLHVNKTIPYLKKTLPEDCFLKIVENPYYSNTYTTVIIINRALEYLEKLGVLDRRPVRQETYSFEDFAGY